MKALTMESTGRHIVATASGTVYLFDMDAKTFVREPHGAVPVDGRHASDHAVDGEPQALESILWCAESVPLIISFRDPESDTRFPVLRGTNVQSITELP